MAPSTWCPVHGTKTGALGTRGVAQSTGKWEPGAGNQVPGTKQRATALEKNKCHSKDASIGLAPVLCNGCFVPCRGCLRPSCASFISCHPQALTSKGRVLFHKRSHLTLKFVGRAATPPQNYFWGPIGSTPPHPKIT